MPAPKKMKLVWNKNGNSFTKSFFLLDFDSIGYTADIDGKILSGRHITVTITNSSYLKSLVGLGMKCKFPMENGIVNIGRDKLGFMSWADYRKGKLKDAFVDARMAVPNN